MTKPCKLDVMPKIVSLSGSIETTKHGFGVWSQVFHDLTVARATNTDVVLSLAHLSWLDANMCAVLGGHIYWLTNEYGALSIEWPKSSKVRSILSRNNFISTLTKQSKVQDYANTTINFTRFRADTTGERSFAGHAYQLFENRDTIIISHNLKRALMRCVLEIFNNSVIHSNSRHGIFSCGQFYPQLHKLRLTITDVGDGILPKVRNHLNDKTITAQEAISWAMVRGNTTKIDVPGGLGLGLLMKFIEINEGHIQIISGNGYWSFTKGNTNVSKILSPIMGTSVSITISTNTNCEYCLDEVDEDDDIFDTMF